VTENDNVSAFFKVFVRYSNSGVDPYDFTSQDENLLDLCGKNSLWKDSKTEWHTHKSPNSNAVLMSFSKLIYLNVFLT